MRTGWVVVTAVAVTSAGTVAVVLAQGHDQPRTAVEVSTIGSAAANEAERYWTVARMAAATPLVGRTSAGTLAARATARSKAFAGVPTIGALFFNNGKGDHYCTASVVNSRSKKLLLTAAHCIHGGKGRGYASRVAFVPKYDRGKRPYGTWTASMLLVDARWKKSGDRDLDFGYVALRPRNGRKIQSVVGYNKLAINQGFGRWVNVAGYPRVVHDRRDRPIYCRTKTRKQAKYQARMDCSGFYGGTSGSPWLLKYNTRTRTGYVNGVIGGHQGGGNVHYISYSPYFDKDVYNLRAAADKRA